MDLRGAYHLLRITAGREWKTIFRCRYHAYEFLVMPSGLTGAPSSSQHFINDMFHAYVDKFVIANPDDFLVYSRIVEEHQNHVRETLKLLHQYSLFARASNCTFHQTSVKYLGYIVGVDGIAVDVNKIQTILDWPVTRQ